MFQEFIFYLTLQSKTRTKLRDCATILEEDKDLPATKDKIEQFIKDKALRDAIDYLLEQGEALSTTDKKYERYWQNLKFITTGHKMWNQIRVIESKAGSN